MIYIAVAMGVEAAAIINYYGLKKDSTVKKVQVFRNEKISLVITGVGCINALISVTHFLTLENPGPGDIFVNIGVAGTDGGGTLKKGDIVLVNKVADIKGTMEFYPDMIFSHGFREGSLITFDEVCLDSSKLEGDMADMEGAGIAKGAGFFMESSQIQLIKIISDYMDGEIPCDVGKLIEKAIPDIDCWLGKISQFMQDEKEEYSGDEQKLIGDFMVHLRLTESMKSGFMSLVKYWKLSGKKVEDLICSYMQVEIKEKKEVKRILNEIRNRVIE